MIRAAGATAALLLVATACVAPQKVASFRPEALRTPDGACVWGDNGRICARVGAANTLADDGVTPTALVYVQDWGWQLSNIGNWQVTIYRPDGSILLQQIPPPEVPELGPCVSGGCLKWSLVVFRLPEPWSTGAYRIQLVCSFNTQIQKDYELTLLDPAAPATGPAMTATPPAAD